MTSLGPRPRVLKVLFLSGLQIHPTLSGGNLRSFALANALQHHGLEVFVYSMVGRKADYLARRPSGIQTWPGGIEEYVDRGPMGFLAQFGSYRLALPPLWITACLRASARSPGEILLPRLLREKLGWCDAVVADFPFVHPIFSAPSARNRLRVLSTHNLEHQLHGDPKRWTGRALRWMIRAVEREAARGCDVLVSCCSGDRQFFEACTTIPRSVLVQNGVDLRRFRGLEFHRARSRSQLGVTDDVKVFLFTASKYGPNREAFDYLRTFARVNAEFLIGQRIHILVVGSVAEAMKSPGLTVTGRVEAVEPYFAAADAALNPMWSGGGTNLKMTEFIALRLPIVSTVFGARGFSIEDGQTGFLFQRETLAPVLQTVRGLFDEDPGRLRRMTDDAYARNEDVIDMDISVRRLVEAMSGIPERARAVGRASRLFALPPAEGM